MRSQPLIVGFNLRFNSTQPHRSRPVIEGVRLRFNSAQQRIKVDLAVDERYSAEKVAAAEYRLALDLLQLSQLAAARLLGISDRSSRRYACAEHPVPEVVMAELWSWVWCIARLPEDDQPLAYAALWMTSKSKQESVVRRSRGSPYTVRRCWDRLWHFSDIARCPTGVRCVRNCGHGLSAFITDRVPASDACHAFPCDRG